MTKIGSIRVRSAPKFGDKEILTWRFRICRPFGLIFFPSLSFGLIPNHRLLGHVEAYFFSVFFLFRIFPIFPIFPYLFPPFFSRNTSFFVFEGAEFWPDSESPSVGTRRGLILFRFFLFWNWRSFWGSWVLAWFRPGGRGNRVYKGERGTKIWG